MPTLRRIFSTATRQNIAIGVIVDPTKVPSVSVEIKKDFTKKVIVKKCFITYVLKKVAPFVIYSIIP